MLGQKLMGKMTEPKIPKEKRQVKIIIIITMIIIKVIIIIIIK